MSRHDTTTRWRRSWGERHPVLFEVLGIIGAVAIVAAITALALYVLTEEPDRPVPWDQVLAANSCTAVPRLHNPLKLKHTVYECLDGTRVGP